MYSTRTRSVMTTSVRRARGMTLVEVLVTLVIISVGLLGVAGLQLTTLRNNYDAYVRSQAAMLAADILDRMRANRDQALNNQYTIAIGATPGTTTAAERDLGQWKTTLRTQLPNGDGAVRTLVADPVTGLAQVVEITIQWGERGEANPIQFVTSSSI